MFVVCGFVHKARPTKREREPRYTPSKRVKSGDDRGRVKWLHLNIHTVPFTEYRKSDLFSDVNTRLNRTKPLRSKNDRLRSTPLSPRVGYMHVSKADGSQVLDLQRDALTPAGVPSATSTATPRAASSTTAPAWRAVSKTLRPGDTPEVCLDPESASDNPRQTPEFSPETIPNGAPVSEITPRSPNRQPGQPCSASL